MVLELAAAARDGLADPAPRIAPLVEALLERRSVARDARDFTTADALRDRLVDAGVEVRDGTAGASWVVRQQEHPRARPAGASPADGPRVR